MNKTANEYANRKSRERIADKDREAQERIAEKTNVASVKGALYKTAGSLGAAALKGLANSPLWYKSWVPSDKFVRLPTYNANGTELPFRPYTANTYSGPSLLVYNYLDTVGNQDPLQGRIQSNLINRSTTMFLAEMRKLNSRVGEYEPPEVGLYIMGVTSIFQRLHAMRTAIRAASLYNCFSKYIGDMMIVAKTGIPAATFRADIANIKQQFELMVYDAQSNLPLPKGLSYVDRKCWLESVVLKDSELDKAQYYMFSNKGMFLFDDVNNKLTFTAPTGPTVAAWFNDTQKMINAFKDSPTMQTFLADLRGAVKLSNCIDFKYLAQDMDKALEVGVSDEVLSQMQNIDTLPNVYLSNASWKATGTTIDTTTLDVYVSTTGFLAQGNPALPQQVGIQLGSGEFTSATSRQRFVDMCNAVNTRLNFYKNEVDGDDILVATRFKYHLTLPGASGADTVMIDNCGTELCHSLVVYEYNGTIITTLGLSTIYVVSRSTSTEWTPAAKLPAYCEYGGDDNLSKYTSYLSVFDWAPFIHIIHVEYTWADSSPVNTINFTSVYSGRHDTNIGEIGNMFIYSAENLKNIHDLAVTNMFYLDSKVFVAV